jgi:hypothetical protein
MKKAVSIFLLIISSANIFAFAYTFDDFSYSCKQYDGIDKRISSVKKYLSTILSKKELNSLSFTETVVHDKDSTTFFAKIPFKDKRRAGFVIVKKRLNYFQYVNVKIEGYQFKDKCFINKKIAKTVIEIISKDKELNKKFVIHASGKVDKMIYPKPANGIRDTAFSIVPFMVHGSLQSGKADPDSKNTAVDDLDAFIDTNFIFESIDSLNYQKITKGVIIHDMIPLSFKSVPSFELEFSNSEILEAIDIRKMLGTVDSISVKH